MNIDNQEDRFNKAFVKFIRYFNLLELNVGLSISFLHNIADPKSIYPKLMKMTCEQKIDKLKELLISKNIEIKEFNAWYDSTTIARGKRNRYLHGNWEYLPNRSDKPVRFSAPPWMKEKYADDAVEKFSLDEFDDVAEEMKNVFDELMQIRRKYKI